jgi:hypothetical protein
MDGTLSFLYTEFLLTYNKGEAAALRQAEAHPLRSPREDLHEDWSSSTRLKEKDIMKKHFILSTLLSLACLGSTTYGSSMPDCEMTAISGLWPDGVGGWYGSSRMEWLNCSDGKDYRATCSHKGSGDNMDACACAIDEDVVERSCEGLISSPSLSEASRQCCGFFEADSQGITGKH